jgi:MFS family permease
MRAMIVSTATVSVVTPPDPTRLRLLYGATLCNFLAFGLYFTAIQLFVGDELGRSTSAVGLAIGVFSVSGLVVRPFVGRAIDRRGRKPFMLAALAILVASSLGFLAAGSLAAVIALRLLQGVASAGFYTTAASAATDLAPPERRAAAIAKFSLFIFTGFALGPAIAEQLIAHVGYTPTWLLAAVLGGVAMVCIALLPETGGAAIALHRERAASGAPAAPKRFLHPAALGAGLVLAASSVGYASITGFSKLYAVEIGLGSAGALYVVFALTIIGTRVLSGSLGDRYSKASVVIPGLAGGAAGMLILSLVPVPVAAFVGVAVFGAGHALIFPPLMSFVVERVEDHERGEALGSLTALNDVGQGLGSYAIGAVSDRAGFGAAYAVPAALIAGAAVLMWRLGVRHPAANRPRPTTPIVAGRGTPAPPAAARTT